MKYPTRNGLMLTGPLANHGYDWWWHSFLAEGPDGKLEAFFIEVFVINPGLATPEVVLGQRPGAGKPCYAMIKAGKWGKDKAQLHNFWPVSEFKAATKSMDVQIGPNVASETRLRGEVSVSPQQAREFPEMMSDAGTMSWNLTVNKQLSYSVGYGASAPLRALRAFDMFWHVEGMKTAFEGELTYNGVRYLVKPDTCAGYQDKNWGRDFTSPWIWLNCNRFVDEEGQTSENTSLDIGGGLPRVWGVPLGEKVLAAFYLRGKLHQFNFSHVILQQQRWECTEEAEVIRWKLDLKNRTHRLEVEFTCPKDDMLLVNYENPAGQKNHNRLWNGGHASGTLVLTTRCGKRPVARLTGTMGGCEYGRV